MGGEWGGGDSRGACGDGEGERREEKGGGENW